MASTSADSGGNTADGATLNDVARVARVSRQTVSNVLNAPGRVRPDTAERVRQAIDELGYRPHRLARNLKTRASRMIGYEITRSRLGVLNPVLDRFVHALVEAAENDGYHVLLFTPDEDGLVTAYDELVGTRTVDGFVLSDIDYGDPRAVALAERGVPFVTFGRPEIAAPHSWVDVDGAAGTAAAVRHVAELGHERIAFIGAPAGSATGDRRAEGFLRAAGELGLTGDDVLDVRVDDDIAGSAEALEHLLSLDVPPTAIVCISDAHAVGVLRAAAARGLVVGRDLAVTGFDDSPLAPLLTPPLTSVRQPLEAVAHRIVANLTTALADPATEPAGELLAPELVTRASTRPD
ncbi:LacI family DNA-binding transcriptional regulator [Phytoactinopolyspora halotolerans]|uniref:LacI family transcriptional regulator n=1 Tax=Phytoactinopolyspora halotolerans TaxID=1981512 RepID=A0A6L9SJ15_9ACTN|nr:LacI family DNA-binding transcriptional regulator [Phytoactinopolyspora halotolerans]NEE04070.1 LacI family transcriptional regulator [Phytoactinopolyspora halotolerans]